MNFKNLLLTLVVLCSGTMLSGQCLDGQTFDIKLYVDGVLVPEANDWALVGAGVEFPEFADNNGTVDIGDGMITLVYTGSDGTAANNFQIELFSPALNNNGITIHSASLDGSSTVDPIVSNTMNTILIDLPSGTSVVNGDMAKINVYSYGCDANPVPTMGQWAMMILALSMTSLAVARIFVSQKAVA